MSVFWLFTSTYLNDANIDRLSTTPKVLKKGQNKEPSMVIFNRAKLSNGKAATFARLHRGDLMASGGAGDALEEALEVKDNGRPGGMGWVKLTAVPTLTYRRGASRDTDDSGKAEQPEMSAWDEADDVQQKLEAKRKAKREELLADKEAREAKRREESAGDATDRLVVGKAFCFSSECLGAAERRARKRAE